MTSVPMAEQKESKQAYLRRCVRECTAQGMAEQDAFTACTLAAGQFQLADETPCRRLASSVALLEKKEAEPRRRCAILAYTGEVVTDRWSPFVIDLAGIVLKTSIPVLLQHDVEKIVGQSDGSRIDAAGLHIFGVLSAATESARTVLALADEGYPWQASIGVRPLEILSVSAGQRIVANGREIDGPVDVWIKASVDEISFVSLGADANTAAIVLAAQGGTMPENTKNTPTPEQGQPAGATLPEAPKPESLSVQATLAPQAPQATLATQDLQAVQLERRRVDSIMALCAKTGIGLEQAQGWIAEGLSLQDAQGKALDLLAARPGGKPIARVELGIAEGDRFRALAAEGIALAHGWKPASQTEGSGQFRGMGLADMARLALERAGVNTLGLSRKDVADRLFSSRYRLAASVSDFSAVYMDVGQKVLLQSYAEAGRTFDVWTSRRSANDFRDMYSISLSEMGDLDQIGENEEYRTGQLSDHAESFRIYKYGKLLSISWEMIVNDDLSAFSRIPQMLGAATARKYSDVVYGLLTGTGKMSDGLPLFNAGHANLVTAAAISSVAMNAARLAMRSQKGLGGAKLNLSPSFLLVPPSLENTAYVLLNSSALPEKDMSAAVYNPWNDGRVTPIVEQRLEPASGPGPWYLVASPAQVSTIEVAYLYGNDAPEITEEMSFRTDAFTYKVRACMGAGISDFRGFVKNPGANA